PDWLSRGRLETIIQRLQTRLEWTTRKINMNFYKDGSSFMAAHNLGTQVIAITKISNGTATVLIGPKVTDKEFDATFGHEMVHVILFQKYKGAIPKWLEEGLANHLSEKTKVDYKWLARHPLPADVRELAHPLKGSADTVLFRYKASQAFAEMLSKKCDLENLIRLSVGRKIEDYIKTYCEIKDMNAEFKSWVTKNAA
ncbi:MAG: hypothetical protein AABZ31_13620, partial [Bdellovibrionota bacterium]